MRFPPDARAVRSPDGRGSRVAWAPFLHEPAANQPTLINVLDGPHDTPPGLTREVALP